MYIADTWNNRIQKWVIGASSGTTVAGDTTGANGSALNTLSLPYGVFVDQSQNVYVADTGNYRIMYWGNGMSTGSMVAGTGAYGNGSNELGGCEGIYVDSSGTMYITDFNNHRVVKWTAGAATGSVAAGGNGISNTTTQLGFPWGIAVDTTNSAMYIANWGLYSISKWSFGATSGSTYAGTAGIAGSTATTLLNPANIILDSYNNLYVADAYNMRIQMFCASSPTQGVTIAGINQQQGYTSLKLSMPYGLALDSGYNLYVADTMNHRIQKFSKAS
ncbi:unnamed protein product [Didymodactylos carnosus]|nr:unnamed protein product [Didymodactylos carnosus]CAF4196713.1 unnamed protein product [Didymodactylos carnosus]